MINDPTKLEHFVLFKAIIIIYITTFRFLKTSLHNYLLKEFLLYNYIFAIKLGMYYRKNLQNIWITLKFLQQFKLLLLLFLSKLILNFEFQ